MRHRRQGLTAVVVFLAGAVAALLTAGARAAERRSDGCRISEPTAEIRWLSAGSGMVVWTDGRSYSGSLRGGRPSGHGTHVWPDGRRYTGDWRDGACNGFGTLSFPDGRRYIGRFERGRATGHGEFISAMGTRYTARVEPDGTIRPGSMLGPRSPRTASLPGTLDEWLRGP
ncbi:MAG TPA: hypothetical protein VD978_19740 [Azospirillum sp.]|nr:hypothetical protein [Azospirillum sp.]